MKTDRLCIYTALIGTYEHLNEQPAAADIDADFICLTDDRALTSTTWTVRHVDVVFPNDPIRSQRVLKLNPETYLDDYEQSLYIDNSVILTDDPRAHCAAFDPAIGLMLPRHSCRTSVLDEFMEVVRLGFDDSSRVFEQLNHYSLQAPDVLEEVPYWNAILWRRHDCAPTKRFQALWSAHVHRYSRRDQLSANMCLKMAGVTPQVMLIDNLSSPFHRWPETPGRDRGRGMRNPETSLMPLAARIRELTNAVAHLTSERAKLESMRDEAARRYRDAEDACAEQERRLEHLEQQIRDAAGRLDHNESAVSE